MFGALSFLSFEIVSYFDIRISNLVAAKGRAKFIRVHPWLTVVKKERGVIPFGMTPLFFNFY
uniref:hypothetical protein n=1 Tax=Candidatus Wunengus sp. YC63 TaxID=3367699 RepID=UPI00402690FF